MPPKLDNDVYIEILNKYLEEDILWNSDLLSNMSAIKSAWKRVSVSLNRLYHVKEIMEIISSLLARFREEYKEELIRIVSRVKDYKSSWFAYPFMATYFLRGATVADNLLYLGENSQRVYPFLYRLEELEKKSRPVGGHSLVCDSGCNFEEGNRHKRWRHHKSIVTGRPFVNELDNRIHKLYLYAGVGFPHANAMVLLLNPEERDRIYDTTDMYVDYFL